MRAQEPTTFERTKASLQIEFAKAQIKPSSRVTSQMRQKLLEAVATHFAIMESDKPVDALRDYLEARKPYVCTLPDRFENNVANPETGKIDRHVYTPREYAQHIGLPKSATKTEIAYALINWTMPHMARITGVKGGGGSGIQIKYLSTGKLPNSVKELPASPNSTESDKEFELSENLQTIAANGQAPLLAEVVTPVTISQNIPDNQHIRPSVMTVYVWCPKADEWRPEISCANVEVLMITP
jgi:hypothetical protein